MNTDLNLVLSFQLFLVINITCFFKEKIFSYVYMFIFQLQRFYIFNDLNKERKGLMGIGAVISAQIVNKIKINLIDIRFGQLFGHPQ